MKGREIREREGRGKKGGGKKKRKRRKQELPDFKPGAFYSQPRLMLQTSRSGRATGQKGFYLSFINPSNCLSFS